MKLYNKRAQHEYTILDRFESGIILTGPEVKSVRAGHVSLTGSYVHIVDGKAQLLNAQISPYAFARVENYDPKRSRILLLHKQELVSLSQKVQQDNLALVPLSLYLKNGKIKVEIGLAKGKKLYEKREMLRRSDMRRELERDFRGKVRT